MKKMTFIAAICLIFAATIHAQSITPMQLKQARMAVYQWFGNYEDRCRYSTRYDADDRFINLFENDSVLIPNDLIYRNDFDFENQSISVLEYANNLFDSESLYLPVANCLGLNIEKEWIDGNSVHYLLSFKKIVSAGEKGIYSDDRRTYPEYELSIDCHLIYLIDSKEIFAREMKSDLINDFVIFKENGQYSYSRRDNLLQLCEERKTPLISYHITKDSKDTKIQSLQADTMKFNFHMGAGFGMSRFSTKYNDSYLTNFRVVSGISGDFAFGMYFQFLLKERNRWGMEISPTLNVLGSSVSCDYAEKYESVDPDGGAYLRNVNIFNYFETIKRYQVTLPLAIRYDYFIKDDLTVFTRIGIGCSYDIFQQLKATGDASYAGYYDWLYGVTIDQNGIYDFGQYKLNNTSYISALSKLSLSVCVGAGVQYFIPNTKWSLDASIVYSNVFYCPIHPVCNYHLSDNINDWNSVTNLFNNLDWHRLNVSLTFNRNF